MRLYLRRYSLRQVLHSGLLLKSGLTSPHLLQGLVFKNSMPKSSHLILPVIHLKNDDQAIRNASMAFEVGADGVFLIAHGGGSDITFGAYLAIRDKYPDIWIGVNLLGWHPIEVFDAIPNGINAIWADDADIDENGNNQDSETLLLAQRDYTQRSGNRCLYFGGVDHKCGRKADNLINAAGIASKFMDYVCTSGPGTGKSADVSKIRAMAEGATKPLAIASGITPENVQSYLPYAKAFLVATGISSDFYNFDRERLAKLVHTVRGWNPPKEPA